MNVLLTNDDGITAPGLRALYYALRNAGHNVMAVAPMRQQSGVGHSLTVFEPLRTCDISDGSFLGTGVYGTPTDCVKLALAELVPQRPDLVIAGINLGQNVGPDIFYSGTVGAAAEASHDNIPSMAVSHACHEGAPDLDKVAEHAVKLATDIDWHKIPPHRVININYPACNLENAKGPRLCPQSSAVWQNVYSMRHDPRGKPYWWLNGDMDASTIGAESDRGLLLAGYITVTPLKFEYTDHDCLDTLDHMGFSK